jgi:sugar/nucleoside kinase (ribokinase family)
VINVRPLLVLSNVILDDIRLADGSERPGQLGGAAVYAAVGAAFWWPKVGIVAGVGADLDERTQGRLNTFGLLPQGLLQRDPCTISSRLVYALDGSRSETPLYGEAHFQRLQITPDDIPLDLLPAAATYIFRGVDPSFWMGIRRQRETLGVILWELEDDPALSSLWTEVEKLLPVVDIISLNLSEATSLLGDTSAMKLVERLLTAGALRVLLRMGADGALIADRNVWVRLMPPKSSIIDVTGGGNCFGGAFLAAYQAQPEDIERASRCAAASAARCLGQFGPPNPLDREGLEELADRTRLRRMFDRRPRPERE